MCIMHVCKHVLLNSQFIAVLDGINFSFKPRYLKIVHYVPEINRIS